VDHFAELVRAARGHLHGRQLAAGPRQIVGQHPPPPDVLAGDPVAFPELDDHQRRADFLAGMQHQMRPLLPGANPQPARRIGREVGRPLPRPADRDDDAGAGPGNVEIRPVAVAGPPARCRDPLRAARFERRFQRLEIVGRARAADVVVQDELAAAVRWKGASSAPGCFRERIGDVYAVPVFLK
jgi:hypothetical protein